MAAKKHSKTTTKRAKRGTADEILGKNVLLDGNVADSISQIRAFAVFLESYAGLCGETGMMDGEAWGHELAHRLLTEALENLGRMQAREYAAAKSEVNHG